ncbi:MAG: glucose-6-phosphate dehydrogenase assembly protein OpcA [Deltaproteobacteria bacterium]|nr:glucose-6-phosphate dehydrogenase assembly protein OpcA [Deltaproteobacteria bacterium]
MIDEGPLSGERLPVDAAAIERELAQLWKSAGADQGQGVVTRACLWNVVAHVERRVDRDGVRGADGLAAALHTLPERVPSRTLLLETHAEEEGRPALECWVSANCTLGEGGHYVCSEEITIVTRGTGDRHLSSLVRALLVPDVPTAVLFAALPPEDELGEALVHLADRLVVEADTSALPDPLFTLTHLESPPLGVIDLGWLDGCAIREQIADLFEQRPSGDPARIRGVRAGGTGRVSRALLRGWIASRLGGRRLEGGDLETPAGEVELQLDLGDEVLRVHGTAEPRSAMLRVAQALQGRAEDQSFREALGAFRT